jgi:hypothetical protein
LSSEDQPAQSLTERGESLLDVTVPDRAGAIVTEFVASIIGEADSRVSEAQALAEEDALKRRLAAWDAAGRVRARLDAVATEIASVHSGLMREADALSEVLRRAAAGQAIRPALGEHSEAASAEDVAAEPEPVVDAEVVEQDAAESSPEGSSPEESPAPGAREGPSEDVRRQVAPMTDSELAHAYVAARRALQAGGGGDPRHSRILEAAVEEALVRPAFASAPDAPAASGGLVGRLAGRRRASAMAELREASRVAREHRARGGP